jgi:hypothetical protein
LNNLNFTLDIQEHLEDNSKYATTNIEADPAATADEPGSSMPG